MTEQATASADMAAAAVSMRQQSEQAAKALKEQARVMKDMTAAVANTSKQVRGITNANRAHSQAAGAALQDLIELRKVAERNAGGVRQTRASTDDLLRYAGALSAVVGDLTKKPH